MAQVAKKLKKVEEQLHAPLELIPSNNYNPFWQSSLFNEVYLLNDAPVKFKEMWEQDEAGPFYEFCNQFRNLCEELKDVDLETWSERKTINGFIKHVLKMLGYAGTATQEPWAEDEPFTVKENGETKVYKPDFIVVHDPKELKYIEKKKGDEKLEEARSAVIVPIEAKYWGRIDDVKRRDGEDAERSDKRDEGDSARTLDFDEQCLKYMEILNKDFGILTDGKTWRLYSKELSSDSYRRNFQFNLGHLMKHVNAGLDRDQRDYEIFLENAKYFFHIFSKTALYSETGERRFLDDLLEYSKKYVTKVEDDLKVRFVKAMAYACNGFQRAMHIKKEKEDLTTIRNVAESHLFNILFIKHCESRNILPLKQSPEYRKISISNTIDKLEHFKPDREEELTLPLLRRMFSKDFNYAPSGYELYDRLMVLTKIVQHGTKAEFKEFEIKGFQEGIFSKDEWSFAQAHKLCNSEMVSILFQLGYCDSDIPGRRVQQIPYNFFSPRQLGSIYESFLEFKLEKASEDMAFIKKQWQPANLRSEKIRNLEVPKVKKGDLFFSPDNEDRKMSGSYYTPDNVVQYIVRQTLAPIVFGKSSDALLGLSVCDSAMGSGHFLSAALNFLANEYLRKKKAELNDDLNLSLIDAKRLVLHNCVFGVDINARAVKLAKMSLWLESAAEGTSLEPLDDQLLCRNSVFVIGTGGDTTKDNLLRKIQKDVLDFKDSFLENSKYKGLDAQIPAKDSVLELKADLPVVYKRGGFDAILMNPPYLAFNYLQNDLATLSYCKLSLELSYKFNLYTAILTNALSLLKDGGGYGFIVPNSISKEKFNLSLRTRLMEKTKVLHALVFNELDEEVFPDASNDDYLVLVGKALAPEKQHKISVDSMKSANSVYRRGVISQSEVCANFECQFQFQNVDSEAVMTEVRSILEKIEKGASPIGEFATIRVGVTPSRAYKKKYGQDYDSFGKKHSNKKTLLSYINANKEEVGVHLFRVATSERKIVWDRDSLYADKVDPGKLEYYESRKIITRNRGTKIFAGIDEGSVVSDIFNICVPEYDSVEKKNFWKKVSLETIVGLLQSSVFNFYFKKKFAFRDFKSTFLRELPVSPVLLGKVAESIAKIASKSGASKDPAKAISEIDALLFAAFDFSKSQIQLILDFEKSELEKERPNRKAA